MNSSLKSEASLRALLRERIGLDEASIGAAALDRGITRAMKAAGCASSRDFCEYLRKNPAAVQALIEEVVVPETWFFRDPAAFSVLQSMVAELLRVQPNRPIRVLSIPCATGEEPYSIAISLLESLRDPARFTVVAADISERAVAKAKKAEYSVRAFRGQSLGARREFLEKSAGGFRVAGAVRARVEFRIANLLVPDLRIAGPYDCIFCRNLLIYIDRSLKDAVTMQLSRMLTAEGVLFVASAEAAWLANSPFQQIPHLPFAFRKRRLKEELAGPAVERVVHETRTSSTAAVDGTLDCARAAADAGLLEEAARHCRLHLERERTSVDGHYLLGQLYDAMDDSGEAIVWYRRALYLDPSHQDAMQGLALLHEKRGELLACRQWKQRLNRLPRNAS